MPKKKDPKDILKSGTPVQWTDKKLKKAGEELVAYITKENVFHISNYDRHKGHHVGWVCTLARKYPIFRPYLQDAQHILGTRILESAMAHGPGNYVIAKFLPLYLKDLSKYEQDQKDLDFERELKKEKYKSSLNSGRDEEIKPRIDNFNLSQVERAKILKLEKFIESRDLTKEWDKEQSPEDDEVEKKN